MSRQGGAMQKNTPWVDRFPRGGRRPIPSGFPVVRALHTSVLSEDVNTAFKNRPDERDALLVCNAIRFNLN
jgi:hypothetical protein